MPSVSGLTSIYSRQRICTICVCLLICGAALVSTTDRTQAQEETSRRPPAFVEQSLLDQGLGAAKADKELDEEKLTAITNIYDQAGRDLAEMGRLANEEARFASMTDSAAVSYTHLTLPTIYSV